MNDMLAQLQQTLHNASQAALSRMHLGDSLQIAHERKKLIDWLGGAWEPGDSGDDRLAEALRLFEQNRNISGLRHARLVCYGCTQPFGTPPRRLIERGKLFTTLLEYVGRHSCRPRLFRKCYRGLLNGYFSHAPHGAGGLARGRHNWKTLRKFLDKHKGSLQITGYNPAWVHALPAHYNLLGADPCGPYRLENLEKNLSVFDDLRERLEISDDSWVIRQIIFSQVRDAIVLDDTAFRASIDSLLLLIIGHPMHADAALAMLLDRYARCEQSGINPELRDFSVKLWGNPWIAANAHQWQCGSEAREMIGKWLKRHLLQGFFSILSDVDTESPRRLNFWELYCEDMQGMYFALGKGGFMYDNLDVYRFRQDAKDLVVRLTEEEKGDIHAFIMQFQQQHVVEFNHHHNGAYFYDTRHGVPPFYLSKGWVDVGALSAGKMTQGADTAPLSTLLRHRDTSQLAWEGKFARLMGASENAIREFCKKYHCRHEDLRTQGGREWIRLTDQTRCGAEAWSVLRGWGFNPSPDKRGYYRG